MLIRPAYTKDINELVSMYKELIKSVHPKRKIGSDYHFYKAVISWIDLGFDIIVTEKNGVVSGFYMAYVDDMDGLTQSVYLCSELFIKPEYRKSKAFYLLKENLYQTAKHKKLILIADAVKDIQPIYKKLGCKETLIRYEKDFNE